MKNTEKKVLFLIIIILIIVLGVILFLYFNNSNSESNSLGLFSNDKTNQESASEDFEIVKDSTEVKINYTNEEQKNEYTEYDAKINLDSLLVEGNGASVSNKTITISKKGVYYFSGTAKDANIAVNAGDDDIVVLVFDGANITSSNTSIINGMNAKEIIVNLAKNSTNEFTDSEKYTVFTDEEEPNSLIFSKTDLCINGDGKLIVNANYNDGIASKDNLTIINSQIELNSKDDGIRGKDSVVLKNVNLIIKSDGDGIKSTNEIEGKGYVYIDGGTIDIESKGDGIDCETVLNINDAKIDIVTSGDVQDKTNTVNKDFGGKMKNNQENDYAETTTSANEEESISSKGLKAGKELTINSGSITINSTDDSIHSNGFIIINDIDTVISTGDDGITADTSLIINKGKINIKKSYEGLEAQYIEINGGDIDIISSDDGINVYGGSDNMFMGRESQASNIETNRLLVINAGNVFVNASGDGLDSNGAIEVNGGTIIVAGPTNSGNGALDYNYSFKLTGGDIIYYGASGMWQDASSSENIYTVSYTVSNGSSGDKIVLKDSDGNTISTVTAEKSYQRISLANEKIKQGTTYTLFVNDNEVGSIEVTNSVSSNSSNNRENGQNFGREHQR